MTIQERWLQRQYSTIHAAVARTRYVGVIVIVVNSVNITIIAANSSLFRHFANDETDVGSTTTDCLRAIELFSLSLVERSSDQIGHPAERFSR